MAHGYNTQQKGISEIGSAKTTNQFTQNNRFVDPNKNLTPISYGYSIYVEFGITPITAEP